MLEKAGSTVAHPLEAAIRAPLITVIRSKTRASEALAPRGDLLVGWRSNKTLS
jgi:hypothetical protein